MLNYPGSTCAYCNDSLAVDQKIRMEEAAASGRQHHAGPLPTVLLILP